ncbi:hypothetical protein EAG_09617 [Camponotus floridanus]|uniref:Uncharacterized protein n=1 Tax=Camponotus floridanus TaxID=104421 RepID=E2AJH1_CAMFO|nr:hypothetical protein EAG_09617 [Camponotus floridanus]
MHYAHPPVHTAHRRVVLDSPALERELVPFPRSAMPGIPTKNPCRAASRAACAVHSFRAPGTISRVSWAWPSPFKEPSSSGGRHPFYSSMEVEQKEQLKLL